MPFGAKSDCRGLNNPKTICRNPQGWVEERSPSKIAIANLGVLVGGYFRGHGVRTLLLLRDTFQ
jgi:hypothetical protein